MSDENTKQNDSPYSSLESLIDEIVAASQGSHTRKFCFVLGAGASLESGIPASEILVKQWDQALRNRYGKAHQTWLLQHGIDDSNCSDHYCKYYGKVYEGDRRTAGLNFLESLMEGKVPSFGYAVLADLLVRTANNIVITTNFDHLLEDAITYYTDKIPFVIGHDTLTAYMGIDIKRPVIVKVHGDLRFAPANSEDEVGKLSPAWEKPLKAIMENYHLVFMGYAGNDAGLMDFLTKQATDDDQKMLMPYWMLYGEMEPSEKILTFVRAAKGEFVRHQGFDHFMLKLGAKMGYRERKEEDFINHAKMRWTRYREQVERVGQKEVELKEPSNRDKGTAKDDASECPPPPPGSSIMDDLKTIQGNVISPSVFLADIWSEPYEQQHKRIKEALKKFPSDAWVMGTCAIIEHEAKHLDKAEIYYKQALDIDPENTRNLGNYALFLKNERNDMKKADEYYKKAVDTDPKNAHTLGNYALFLYEEKKDMVKVEEYYQRAITSDPKNAILLGNYATFLYEGKKDMAAAEEYYQRAIKADPRNTDILSNYALFLKNEKQDMTCAEEYYKKAIEANPKNVIALSNYANFLYEEKKNMTAAEEYYQRAIAFDPKNANALGNYATFLKDEKQDFAASEEFYKRAIEADPKHAITLGNYALFLYEEKRDMTEVEEYYKRAIKADPRHTNTLGNYATFLKNEKKDIAAAEEFYKRTIEADPKHATSLGNYANFLNNEKKDMEAAEEFYKQAIAADPNHANNLGNYAAFLSEEKKDLATAKKYYRRAIDADPKHANNLGNYALFLENDRKNPEQAETIYKIALERCPDNVRLLRLYAGFLSLYREDETQAQELEKRADEIEKNSPS